MISVLHETGLYFKTDELTRGRFDETDQSNFVPSQKHQMRTYRQVPDVVTETDEALRPRLMDAIGMGKRQAIAKRASEDG